MTRILLPLLFIFLLGFIVTRVWRVLISIFGFGKDRKEESQKTSSSQKSTRKQSKIFSKSEGEYVDYEEIK